MGRKELSLLSTRGGAPQTVGLDKKTCVARRIIALAWLLPLAACASFTARPLPSGPNLVPDVGRLSVDVSRLRLTPLKAHRFDPSAGLDPDDVAVLAVLNSPDLAAKRVAAKVAAAQVFAAGLLPDPQLTLTYDVPVHPAGLVNAYNVNPSVDLMSLVTHSTALRAARAAGRQVDLDLLWSEWGTAQQARQLAATAIGDEAKARLLAEVFAGLDERRLQSDLALRRGDVTSVIASADVAAALDASSQLATALHDAAKARGDLNALIGLAPDLRLPLVAGPLAVDPSDALIGRVLAGLPRRRPDLLALQAGYESQDATLRKALLGRFPLVNLGYSRQSDTSAIITNGLSATLTLPIFNRGRGEIAVQSATRARLAAEYQARLDQTVAEVATARRDLAGDRANLAIIEAQLPRLRAVADEARAALARGDLDSAAYLALEQSALKQQVALLDLRLALDLARITLQTSLFLPSDLGAAP